MEPLSTLGAGPGAGPAPEPCTDPSLEALRCNLPAAAALPLVAFVGFLVFLGAGLGRDVAKVPSPFIGKPAPAFTVPDVANAARQVSAADFKGQVWLLNVWASWCVACRQEHPLLVEFARQKMVPMYGLNYKDKRADGLGWLAQFGNQYDASLFDNDGRVGIDFGVYGVPETFIMDKQGVVRMKHIGPLTPEVIESKIVPLVRQLNG